MQVTLLGTMGWIPSDRRATTCTVCRADETLFILDAGTGLRRLLDPVEAALLDGVRDIHLFLSHYHLDHTCGLAYLAGVLPGRRLTVHPPAVEITGIDPETALANLVRKPYNPADWHELRGITLAPVHEGSQEIAGHTVRVRRQAHSDTSVCWRFDDALVQATDTPPDPGKAEFAAGASLLLHEAWYNAADPRTDEAPAELRPGYAAHSEVSAVAGLAASAGVGRLVLVHLNPLHDESYYQAMAQAAAAVFPRTELHDDGETLALEPV